jgi:hypothetical protein
LFSFVLSGSLSFFIFSLFLLSFFLDISLYTFISFFSLSLTFSVSADVSGCLYACVCFRVFL